MRMTPTTYELKDKDENGYKGHTIEWNRQIDRQIGREKWREREKERERGRER